jgi:acetyl esterase/lipase
MVVDDQLVSEVGHQNVVVMGDGSGGALALSFVQSLLDSVASKIGEIKYNLFGNGC